MRPFGGFPDGAIAATLIPNQFFAEVLPAIGSLAELKVTLYVMWRTGAGGRAPAWLSIEEIVREPVLLDALADEPDGAATAIAGGLRQAIERGTIIGATVAAGDGERTLVAVNTSRGRRALAELGGRTEPLAAGTIPVAVTPTQDTRPAIFALYEQNVGLVQPLIADELRAASELFPAAWIEDAFKQAVAYNKRSWRYVKRILERWAAEGRDTNAAPRDRVAGSGRAASRREWRQTYRPGERLPDL